MVLGVVYLLVSLPFFTQDSIVESGFTDSRSWAGR